MEFDLIIAMDGQNYQDIMRLGFEADKVALMGDYGLQGRDIPDPYYFKDMEGFEKVYSMLESAITELFKTLQDS